MGTLICRRKRRGEVFAAALLAAALAFGGCGNGSTDEEDPDKTPPHVAVTGITGVPDSGYVNQALALTTAGTLVLPEDATYKTIAWSLKDAGDTGSTVENGSLTATAAGIAVVTATIAKGAENEADYTTDFAISISSAQVTSVAISAPSLTVGRGGSLAFTALVTGISSPPTDVTWSIVESALTSGTAISAEGVLSVSLAETAAKLTVKAVSNFDNDKTDTAEVTITAEVPVITEQPKSAIYTLKDSASPLTIAFNTIRDGGTASVQWYVSTEKVRPSWTTIAAVGASYTPSTTVAGVFYYYAEVTNTLSAESGLGAGRAVSLAAQVTVFGTPEQYRDMAVIEDIIITGSGDAGAFPAGRTVTLSAYKIAKYQTTYELWYEVKDWANANGYTLIAGSGGEGSAGTAGAPPTDAKNEPATSVSWRDAVVWCNAYSEMTGRKPVYYKDAAFTELITSIPDDATDADTVYFDTRSGANGFRLPTEAEWEAAARGGDPTDSTNWNYTYAGGESADDVAWHSGNSENHTHPVGGKNPNKAGLYDCNGNIWEWCYDWTYQRSGDENKSVYMEHGEEVSNPIGLEEAQARREERGGRFGSGASSCTNVYRGDQTPQTRSNGIGFRLAHIAD